MDDRPESLVKTPIRQHVGRSGKQPKPQDADNEPRFVPGAELGAVAQRELDEKLEELRRWEARSRMSARSYVLYRSG